MTSRLALAPPHKTSEAAFSASHIALVVRDNAANLNEAAALTQNLFYWTAQLSLKRCDDFVFG